MLRTDLIELINRGDMWVFLGNGTSIESGCPSWEGLVRETIKRVDEKVREEILKDERYIKALSHKRFPRCFSRVEAISGREVIEKAVTMTLDSFRSPGKIIKLLADWPFAGYVTTNYDALLEMSLREIGQLGWVPIGNSADEVRKAAGDATRIIWHFHGAINMPPDKYKMVLTEEDYDELYLDGSAAVTQLRGLLAQRRLLFVGFGFEDPEVMRMLKLVGRLCSSARPAFAFLSGLSGTEHEGERLELLKKYNIDAIPYRVLNGSHDQLLQMLQVYSALILRRSLTFGQPERECPSYDPETTGLMIYNQLALRDQGKVGQEIIGSLLKARVLSLLKHRGPLTIRDINADLSERIQLVQEGERLASKKDSHSAALEKCLADLDALGLAKMTALSDGSSVLILTAEGSTQLDIQAAAVSRLSEQFSACLLDRARESFPDNEDAMTRVAKASECFLKECIKRRALGVAMAWNSPRLDFQRYHIVGLLQSLPEFLVQVSNQDEGLALVRLIEDVLAKPNAVEVKYLGIALQAQFGINLLGYDPETINARAQELSKTLFLLDSSTLIPLLARSSVGHNSARLLLHQLRTAGSAVASTYYLATEVAEHARWAVEHVGGSAVPLTPDVLAVVMGLAGSRSNAFLEGFLEEVNLGKISLDFGAYLDSVCGHPNGHSASDDAFLTAIRNESIPCLALNDWDGFEAELWSERDSRQEQIADRRKNAFPPTYKHERQVKAEAEALIIVQNLRSGAFQLKGQSMADAYFISHTRAIDNVAGHGLPVTMRPQAVLQWLSTVTASPAEELGSLFNNLLWELSERGLSIVDRVRLQTVFSPLVFASRSKFEEEIEAHRALVSRRFGEDPSKAFREVPDLQAPIVVDSYYLQKSLELEKELQKEKKAKEALKEKVKITEKERKEYDALKAKEKQRRKKAQSRQRAAASRAGRRRKK
jgi:hypothetical protein